MGGIKGEFFLALLPVKALREWWLDLKRQDRDLGKVIEASGADSEKAKTKAVEKAEFEKVAFPQGVARTTAAAKTLEDQIFSLNQPVVRKYEIRLMGK